MNNDPTQGILKSGMADYWTALAKGAVNLVPIIGPFLSEIVGVQIPRQRIDRIAKFAADLDQRLSLVEEGRLESQIENEEFTDLIEEGIRQASRSLSDERRGYIASIIANGLSSDRISHAESRHLMRLLGEINDIEVIWLRFHLEPRVIGDEVFRKTHEETLTPIPRYPGSLKDIRDKAALQESYKEHLAQLGMIEPRYETDMQTKMPKFNEVSGAMQVWYHSLTELGRLLLEEIGLSEEESPQ